MKKSLLIFSFLLIAAFTLTACGGNDGDANESGGEESTKGELTMWATNINVPVLEQAAELYKEEHPDFKLNVVEMNNEDIDKKLKIGLQAGNEGLPDAMLNVDDGLSGLFYNFPDAFVNLSEKGFDEHKDQFPSYKIDSVSHEGSIYAFPFDAGPVGVFYRTDLFEQAGVDASQIKTWDDYVEAGKKIKEATGVKMLSYDANESTVYTILLSQQGMGYFNDDEETTIATEESINAATLFQDLAENDLLIGTNGWSPWVTSLSEGQTATAMAGAWLIGTLEQQVPDSAGNWGVMPLPAFEEGGSGAANQGGSSFTINAKSENADLAYDFLEFFVTSYEAQELAMEGGLFPTYAPVYESELFTQELEYFGGQKAWEFFAGQMEKIPSVNYTVNDVVAREEVIKTQAEVVNGTDPEESLKSAKERVETRLK
ncbi:sugar ABC transporter substrate-binding protein [Radiobacillus kanasensis]|uniref:ABC transporter substrate-binding protein n=1 Tax=Radiobacillus kanasensis TaxID=2844358 RepID=UPI001E3C0F8F|nr:sugar ABC transporter substrate-binding protein [Radiobacillus kanasensis]UFT99289.1 sugar ABC transporter substrate-binding protein [Radiobacillus kanasensis]